MYKVAISSQHYELGQNMATSDLWSEPGHW